MTGPVFTLGYAVRARERGEHVNIGGYCPCCNDVWTPTCGDDDDGRDDEREDDA